MSALMAKRAKYNQEQAKVRVRIELNKLLAQMTDAEFKSYSIRNGYETRYALNKGAFK